MEVLSKWLWLAYYKLGLFAGDHWQANYQGMSIPFSQQTDLPLPGHRAPSQIQPQLFSSKSMYIPWTLGKGSLKESEWEFSLPYTILEHGELCSFR
jgi:hypothetical protein